MSTPYRDAWRQLACPRCAERLDDLGGGVGFCMMCEGLWIAKLALARLDELPWPVGNAAWWRSELPCPECAADGTTNIMTARMAGDILVDQCGTHGGWFDRGELARLVHFTPEGVEATAADDFATLRARIAVAAPDPADLAARRAKVRADQDARRTAALAFEAATAFDAERTRLETERAREAAAHAKLETMTREERARRAADDERAARTAAEREAKRAAAEREARERAYAARVNALRAAREAAVIALNRREAELVTAQAHVQAARLHLDAVSAELAEADAQKP